MTQTDKPEIMVHIDRAPTEEDWAKLDPNTYETTCAKCDGYIAGTFGQDHACDTPCPACGSTETKGGIMSPAGAFHLAMWSDF